MAQAKHRALYILLLILLLGAALRLWGISTQSLWGDEGWTYFVTQQADFFSTLNRDVHPPLYFAAISLWSRIGGTSELALRYPSALASVLNIALVVALARELMRHRPRPTAAAAPLLAGLIFALADLDIQVSQEARSYTIQTSIAILSSLAYLRWARRSSRAWGMGWALLTTLMVYVHYLGAFVAGAQLLHALIFLHGRRRAHAIGWMLLAAALFLPWLFGAVIPYQLGKFASQLPTDASDWPTLWAYRISWFTQQWPLQMGLALLGLVLLNWRGESVRLRVRPFNASALLILWVAVPFGLTFALNTQLPLLYDYRLALITPAVMLMIGFGLANFRYWPRTFLVVVIVVYGLTTVDVYRPKPPWREYGQAITREALSGDAIVSDLGGGDYQLTYYLDRFTPPDVEVRSLWQWRFWEPETYENGSLAFMDAHDTIWLARWNDSDEVFARLALTDHVQTGYDAINHVGNLLEIYRFDRLPDTPQIRYDNGMELLEARFNPMTATAQFLWRAETDLDADYTSAAFLLDPAGGVVAQFDSWPGENPTSAWDQGTAAYDTKPLRTPDGNMPPPGQYTLALVVYQMGPNGIMRIAADDGRDLVNLMDVSIPEG